MFQDNATLVCITYKDLYNQLAGCEPSELVMPVQALYFDKVWTATDLRYAWATDGTALLTLECLPCKRALTYRELFRELRGMCSWQFDLQVVIGMQEELAEVLTLYHEFDCAPHAGATLMLIVTPPDAYFEYQAA